MPAAHTALIHDYDSATVPSIDDDGDVRTGFYFQFVDVAELPITGLYGPYKRRGEAEKAAQRAFDKRDY